MSTTIIEFVAAWWFWIDWGTFGMALLSVPSVLVQRRGRPTAAVSWILCLLSIPLLGLLLWWAFGRRHLERRRERKRHAHTTMTARLEELRESLNAPPSHSSALLPLNNLPPELAYSVFEPTTGNQVELVDSKKAFDIMERDIRAAKHHVHALFYILKNDETGRRFRDVLVEKAAEGVKVRVLCDAIGAPILGTRFTRALRKAGAQTARYLPPQLLSRTPRINFRNHRKILIVDGKIGMIGGFNIADEYRLRWRDLGIRVMGPAVDQLQEIFADDWHYATDANLAAKDYFGRWSQLRGPGGAACAVIASGPDSKFAPIHDALFMAINQSRERVYIMTPYFIPSRAILAALRAAVYRDVDVRIMVPARGDIRLVRWASRSYYAELLEVGVRILEYQPEMLHAKVAMFDDELSLIGSANFDSRSFRLNFEASCFVGSKRLCSELVQQFEHDSEQCREVSLAEMAARHWGAKLLDSTANLVSPLL